MVIETKEIVEQLRREEQEGLFEGYPNKYNDETISSYYNHNIDSSNKNRDVLHVLINSTEKSNTAILITDHFGIIKFVNDSFSAISGFTLQDIIETDFRKLCLSNQSKSFFDQIFEKTSSGNIWSGELESLKKNKSTYWQQITIIPIIENETILYNLIINKDITLQKEMQQNLNVKENAILSSINAIVLTDLSGKISYVNPSFLKMWSIDSEKKIIDQPVYSLWKEGGKYVNIMDTIVSRGGWFGEVIARDCNGRLFPVQMSASVVTDDQNRRISIMASFVDITKQKRLEKNYKKFKKISDAADYGTVIFDLEGNILYGNNAFAQMHEYSIDDLIGKHLSILFHEDKKEYVEDMLVKIKEHGRIVGEEQWHISKNGTTFPLLVTTTIINDEQFHQPFVAGNMIDITKIKEAEQKIIQNAEEVKQMNIQLNSTKEQLAVLNQNLENKVKERTKEIKKLLKQKDNFINQLGHDLRTPLTPMFALLPLLSEKINDEKGKQYIDLIQKNSRYMLDLVDKTITYAKLNSENIEFNFVELNIHDFVDNIIKQFYKSPNENAVEINNKIDREFKVIADSIQINEVFQNLISNAIKYKKEESTVHITIDGILDNDKIIISVEDDGIGMSDDQIEKIFNEFYKADHARSDIDSHGLGLNICKRIIEQHDGSIWAESNGIDQGTKIYFSLKDGNQNRVAK
jgi:PAS domain S-box-containing protein